MCKLSIIIPVMQQKKFLSRCLESVFNQNFENYEIIINGHSPGNCKKIVLKYRDNRICYIEFTENLGLHQARVQGATVARSEYLMHLDSDDVLLHDSVLSSLML
ncbi:Glycosyl transferase family 2 [Brevinema andersonii]|uniref:Glycosyl transferase family 2 n=1 Tax=Brevinema andersonii TaxID=34097 RepID=A0A1I1D221_BREAD|nr:glycosyltransferase family 2 protein [Brevinema andersonii]SFB68864.1 Glycosyl transferase family 2 [Brevinema andersonii]